MIDDYNHGISLSMYLKVIFFFLLFTIIYSKINMNVMKKILPRQWFARENTGFSRQKPWLALRALENFEDHLMVNDYMTLILLLYCLKR